MTGEAASSGLGGYPVNLLVDGRRCVVVGGGRIAARKIEALLDAGAVVHVVAPDVEPRDRGVAEAGRLTVAQRPFEPTDLDDAWLATTATADPDSQPGRRSRPARPAGSGCNSADDPANCSFTLMSVVRQGDLVVTIGTGGRSPALATYLKEHVGEEMGPEYATLLDLLSRGPRRERSAGPIVRRRRLAAGLRFRHARSDPRGPKWPRRRSFSRRVSRRRRTEPPQRAGRPARADDGAARAGCPRRSTTSLAREHLAEVVLLSTCNRTEVYARTTLFHAGVETSATSSPTPRASTPTPSPSCCTRSTTTPRWRTSSASPRGSTR